MRLEVRLLDQRRVQAELLRELAEEAARVNQRGQLLEPIVLDRLEVRARDLGLRADVAELEALRFADLPEQATRELGVRTDLALQLVLQHELLGRERGPRRPRGEDLRLGVRKRRQVVRTPAHQVEERLVRLVELALGGDELVGVQERDRRQASGRVDLALALVRPSDLFVARRAGHAEDGVERRLVHGDRRRGPLDLRRRQREDAARDALDVPRALAGGAVDEQRLVAPDGEPDRVVALDVSELVERDAVVA